ncbi:MAG: type II secretion system minor pseudopilin GspK [Thermodesulfovibrionales bacterium]|jgi:general secretion pathway protein K
MSRKDVKARPLGKNKDAKHALPLFFHVYPEKGMALVLTLLILVLITALVTEFSYGVFTTTAALHNWQDSQRLSFIAKSGTSLAMKLIAGAQSSQIYQYLGKDIPVDSIVDGFDGTLVVRAEDESGKFNLNSLVFQNNQDNPKAIAIFKKLLDNLGLSEDIADRVADWIDSDSEPRLPDSEVGAKNAFMDSTDELLLIKGIDHATYEKLLPYVTVYGQTSVIQPNDIKININSASIPVIMSVYEADGINADVETIIQERALNPFSDSDIGTRVPSDTHFITSCTNSYLRIKATAEEHDIKRVIESVVSGQNIWYWREM